MNKSKMRRLTELFQAENWKELEKFARSLVKSDKKNGIAWKALGAALDAMGQDALAATMRALELLPDDPQAHFNVGCALKWHDKHDEACAYYRRAIEMRPYYPEAYSNLGNSLGICGKPYEALKAYWNGIKQAPHLVNIQVNMGNCYAAIGQHARALRMYSMALEMKPDFIEAANSILFLKDLMPTQTVAGAQEDRRKWNEIFAAPLIENRPHLNDRDPDRRLRIGYVSADFREHSAIRSCASIIVHHDRENFEVFAYHTSRRPEDHYTQMIRDNVDHWRVITDMLDQPTADLIREDRIDVLVDLSGHSGGNRLLMFARKPAPIQCTGWGYGTGTGMTAMDAFFADPICVPKDELHLYAEEVRYLPCIDGPLWQEKFPDVSDSPCLFDSRVTFGSLNRLAKVTEETLKLWARVLHAVPTSGMVIKAGEFKEDQARERIIACFAAEGIPSERLILVGPTNWYEHMEAYREIDICLDPFPQGGGVTALEGLMMAVPIIALKWPTIPGRVTPSILTCTGLADWVVESEDAYVAKAVEKAGDQAALVALRKTIRGKFLATVGDAPAYARAVETEYRRMWRRWCQGRKMADALLHVPALQA